MMPEYPIPRPDELPQETPPVLEEDPQRLLSQRNGLSSIGVDALS
jgi:hypothetical protein